VPSPQPKLAEQLAPRDEDGKSDVPAERYEEARAELQRLEARER
jgi:hypothetical protein